MTAKDKAIELSDKFLYIDEDLFCDECGMSAEAAKQCALIAVDEMLNNDGWSSSRDEWSIFKKYCEEVKEELLKL